MVQKLFNSAFCRKKLRIPFACAMLEKVQRKKLKGKIVAKLANILSTSFRNWRILVSNFTGSLY